MSTENVPATDSYMKAKVDGKECTATLMKPPEFADKIQGEKDNEFISLPFRGKNMKVGDKVNFKDYPVNSSFGDDELWSSYKGELIITKVGEYFQEGTFYFTASRSGSSKTFEVTDGSFRILLKK